MELRSRALPPSPEKKPPRPGAFLLAASAARAPASDGAGAGGEELLDAVPDVPFDELCHSGAALTARNWLVKLWRYTVVPTKQLYLPWMFSGMPTNYLMLTYRTFNRDFGLPNHNDDYLAPLLRDELMPERGRMHRERSPELWYRNRCLDMKYVGVPGIVNFIVVIIAAGFDTRAYRLGRPGVKFYEVDLPHASQKKRELVEKLLPADKYPRPEFIGADLSRVGLADALATSSFRAGQRTLYLIEGLVYYLPPRAFKGLLGAIADTAAPGIGGIIAGGRIFIRPLYKKISNLANAEIFAATTLLVVLGTSMATQLAGLSLALGAFLAGLLIAETEFALQVESDILPFKGLLMGLFFMTVGMQITTPDDLKDVVVEVPLPGGLEPLDPSIYKDAAAQCGQSEDESDPATNGGGGGTPFPRPGVAFGKPGGGGGGGFGAVPMVEEAAADDGGGGFGGGPAAVSAVSEGEEGAFMPLLASGAESGPEAEQGPDAPPAPPRRRRQLLRVRPARLGAPAGVIWPPWPRPACPAQETRPAAVTFRYPFLSAGTHSIRFKAVAATPGTFVLPPVKAFASKQPELMGLSPGGSFRVCADRAAPCGAPEAPGAAAAPKRCPGDCSGNGACNLSSGECTCDAGFAGEDCGDIAVV
ncbi:K(+) efflux antiporter chloroplastic-like [Raphidocelis subcapitata]|uniref:K(+) efflux antiporter chloroplastic-like n=1 Tax=Raphidocelis subcapitata TaxID=307507 RepID=A0A2V0PE83_9CHLO|nr:K(+) efflux antiporter chloroplastic-like [Raphidocelis subcapitata]|eukprot:GBF98146.1 K(+) efflux antiporter chloroplastic-like [Raphidocelis subcapitata]